jgi:uncharacterized protein (DUF1330 family)
MGKLLKYNFEDGTTESRKKQRTSWFSWPWIWGESPCEEKPYFVVSAKIVDSKTHSGYRKRIDQDACDYGAMYDIRGPTPSIWYPDNSNDLHISLMFDNKTSAHKFLNCLINYNIGAFSLMKGKLVVRKKVEGLYSRQEGVHVHCDDNKFEDSDSPSNTFHDIQSATMVPNSGDPLQAMRSLEKIHELAPAKPCSSATLRLRLSTRIKSRIKIILSSGHLCFICILMETVNGDRRKLTLIGVFLHDLRLNLIR